MKGLPEGWTETPLAHIVVRSLGGDWGKQCENNIDGHEKVSVVRGTEFKNWKTQRAAQAAQRCIRKSSLESRRLAEGDIVVEISGGGPTQPVGRTILIDKAALDSSPLPLICSNFFRLVRLYELIDPAYVNYFLSYTYSKGSFDEIQTQTTNLRNLNFTQFLDRIIVDLAPLNEQRRIVAKLEKLLSRVNAAQERLATIPRILKRFRQSVLEGASKGSLLGDLTNDDKWNEVTLDEITAELITGPFGSALHRSDYVLDGIPIVNPMNILNGKIVPSRGTMVDETTKNRLSRYVLRAGDIVVARRGELGRCALITDIEAGWLCGTGSAILRPNPSIAISKFVQLVISSPTSRLYLNEGAVGSTMANLNQRVFLALPFPLPSLVEQREIVRRVEALFKTADELEARYLKAKAHVDKLTQSILAKAFRGELVPQDPNDEPASVLLERITADSNSTAVVKRRNRK